MAATNDQILQAIAGSRTAILDAISTAQDTLDLVAARVGRLRDPLIRLESAVAATQDSIDALTAQVTAAATSLEEGIANVRQDIADLKAANPALDTTALEASVASLGTAVTDLSELDSENPAPPAP